MKTALAVAPAALILLAGCTSTDGATGGAGAATGPLSTAPTGSGPAGSTTSTGTPGTSTSTGASATTSAGATPTALPTAFTDVNKTIDDGDLKESITVKRIARQLPWPAGYKASAQAYELVAVEMTWTPSKSYTIPIRKQDFDISTGSQFPNRVDPVVNDALTAAGWGLLPDQVASGDPVSGWVVFKVDPRNAPSLLLDYVRPAAQVSGGGTAFPAKTFSVQLVG
ncbi:MAG: hypothetical protein ABIW80_10300 [Lapillicoccus sp.]